MSLSTKAKEAIKTSLAMVIAYGVALAMGWDKPMWAGFAVAFCSLATFGQSMNKAAMRMLGTLIAVIVALALFAFFIQQRWLLMVGLSLWLGFCTYMMGGAKNQYFWNVCGFVCVIICFDSSRDSASVFATALLRAEQTGLGILAYSLVAILIWPIRSGNTFLKSAVELSTAHQTFYRTCFQLMLGETTTQKAQTLRSQELQLLNQFKQMLAAAETDTYQVWEVRRQWQVYSENVTKLSDVLEAWRTDCNDMDEVQFRRVVTGLDGFNAEMEQRFSQIQGMLKKEPPEHMPHSVALVPDKEQMRGLTHFHRAALTVNLQRLTQVDELSRAISSCLSEIMGFSARRAFRKKSARSGPLVIDPDRLLSFFRVIVSIWTAYLALIFVNDIPGGTGLVTMAGSIGMLLASMPQLPASALMAPSAFAIGLASILYVFVMPQLSTFFGLGLLLFGVTFFFCYFFAEPRQMLGKALGIALFISIAGVSNQQTYSFYAFATTAQMFAILLLILSLTAYFPFNPRPERVFMRLVTRFYRSCEYLIASLSRPQAKRAGLTSLRRAYHLRVISAVPGKLAVWAQSINSSGVAGGSPEDIEAVVISMQKLAYRVKEMDYVEDLPQSAQLLQGLTSHKREWYRQIERTFGQLARDPDSGRQEEFQRQLSSTGDAFEAQIRTTLKDTSEIPFSDEEEINFYSFLGVNRGLSGALLEYNGNAGNIDWQQWRRPRF